jgi:hypothetical protein
MRANWRSTTGLPKQACMLLMKAGKAQHAQWQ